MKVSLGQILMDSPDSSVGRNGYRWGVECRALWSVRGQLSHASPHLTFLLLLSRNHSMFRDLPSAPNVLTVISQIPNNGP